MDESIDKTVVKFVLERIKLLVSDTTLIERLTEETNIRLLKQKPALERQKQGLLKSLADVKSQAVKLIDLWTRQEEHAGNQFVKEKLNTLGQRRVEQEAGMVEIDIALQQIQEKSVSSATVRLALERIIEVYGRLKPFEQRELISLVLKSAEVNEREIILEIIPWEK